MFKKSRVLQQITIGNCQNRLFGTKVSRAKLLLQKPEDFAVHKLPKTKEKDRRLYVWGYSETGALGVQKSLKKQMQKNTAFCQHPTRSQFGERYDIVDVASGYGFSAFAVQLTDGISLFGTGLNTDSQIGYHKHLGITNKPIELMIYPAPIALPKLHANETIQIRKCSAGRAHLLALSDTGIVFAMGNNAYGQCGRKIIDDEMYFGNSTVHRIDNNLIIDKSNNNNNNTGGRGDKELIVNVQCGQDHSIFLSDSGNVYSCGWGADGQTGLGHFLNVDKPERVHGDISRECITKVVGTVDCVLALNDKGEVFGWGNTEYGQLNADQEDDLQQINSPKYLKFLKELGKIIDIAAGGSYCLALNEHGEVFVWGFGILGFGPAVEHIRKPKPIPMTIFGRNEFNTNCFITSIYSGISHCGAITNQNDLYMWGKNKYGCLGLGHQNDQFFPFKTAIGAKVLHISCGVDHTLAYCKPHT